MNVIGLVRQEMMWIILKTRVQSNGLVQHDSVVRLIYLLGQKIRHRATNELSFCTRIDWSATRLSLKMNLIELKI